MKKVLAVLAATLICGASIFTSCSKDKEEETNTALNLSEKIIGHWITADGNGQPVTTNEKVAINFVSATKAYMSASFSHNPTAGTPWLNLLETEVAINGNKFTLTTPYDEHTTAVNEFTISAISASEFSANQVFTMLVDGNAELSKEYSVRYVKVDADYSASIVGKWQGRCTSEGSVFDDGQEHRWEYRNDGSYTYYRQDGTEWVPVENTLNEYFVAGNLLCTRWKNVGEETENREWWEIAINGTTMNWTALRRNADGTTFTATFEMEKVD